MSRQETLEEQQEFDSELVVSPRLGVEQREATEKFEEPPESSLRAITQRQHVQQRAQQGVPIPRGPDGCDVNAWQDRRLLQGSSYLLPRQSGLGKQPVVLPVP